MGKELYKHIENIPPSELARLRDKEQRLSTRDKQRLLKKVAEIEEIINKRGEKIEIKKM